MPTQSWRKSTPVTKQLLDAPTEYQFQQAVRLLERSAVFADRDLKEPHSNFAVNQVARFTPPTSESIRFVGGTSLSFPSAEISHIGHRETATKRIQWQVLVNVMGLMGAMGVLPFHYTELALKRLKQKDETMEKFFDLFNHRTISLFFQASTKYRLPLQYERSRLQSSRNSVPDNHTHALLSLIGMGTVGLNNRLHTKDESLVYYSGLFSQKIRTSTGLKQILRSHFEIPVEIDQFVGQWQPLIDDVRSKLPDSSDPKGRNVRLGRSAMLGKSGWFAQGKIRIILGPLNKRQLQNFAPGTSALKALHELARLYVGLENDYELIIRVKKSDFPDNLAFSKSTPLILGWNTRLPGKTTSHNHKQQTLDISVSSRRLT